jgi:hypothetical protein
VHTAQKQKENFGGVTSLFTKFFILLLGKCAIMYRDKEMPQETRTKERL